nr:DUF4135 domain-containing protein [Neorhizobium galegae]
MRWDLSESVISSLNAHFRAIYTELYRPVVADFLSTEVSRSWLKKLGRATRQPRVVHAESIPKFLSDIIETTARHEIACVKEFLDRLSADHALLTTRFCMSASRRITGLRPGLSDRHNLGRSVICFTVADGHPIFYKPRSLFGEIFAEAVREEVCKWLADNDAIPSQRLIDSNTHGWSVGVAQNNDKVDFLQAGRVLALHHILQTCDLHHQNVIFSDGEVHVVDLECVVHPTVLRETNISKELLQCSIVRTPLSSQLLPVWYEDEKGLLVDPSPLGPILKSIRDFPNGISALDDAFENIMLGYSEVYRAATLNASSLKIFVNKLMDENPRAKVRLVVRPTSDYRAILRRAYKLRNLRDDAEWNDSIRRQLSTEHPALQTAERSALSRLDYPIFSVGLNAQHAEALDGGVAALSTSPREQLLRSIDGLSMSNLEAQKDYIRASRWAIAAGSHLHSSKSRSLEDTLHLIAEIIELAAIRYTKQPKFWLHTGRFKVDGTGSIPHGFNFYNGSLGVHFFRLLHAKFISSGSKHSDATETFKYFCSLLNNETLIAEVQDMSGAGISGLGGMIYALSKAAPIIDDADYSAKLYSLPLERIRVNHECHDIVGGNSGILMGLLAHHATTSNPSCLRVARQVADHIIGSCTVLPTGTTGWMDQFGRILTGFAHGISGIAFSVANFAERSGIGEYANVLDPIVRSENLLYSNSRRNWPDLRTTNPNFSPFGWCHGAPGIVMARLLWPESQRTKETYIEYDLAKSLLIDRERSSHSDRLCCGRSGLVQILLRTYFATGDEDFRSFAGELINEMVNEAYRTGWFELARTADHTIMDPGLYRGISGVGLAIISYITMTQDSLIMDVR